MRATVSLTLQPNSHPPTPKMFESCLHLHGCFSLETHRQLSAKLSEAEPWGRDERAAKQQKAFVKVEEKTSIFKLCQTWLRNEDCSMSSWLARLLSTRAPVLHTSLRGSSARAFAQSSRLQLETWARGGRLWCGLREQKPDTAHKCGRNEGPSRRKRRLSTYAWKCGCGLKFVRLFKASNTREN